MLSGARTGACEFVQDDAPGDRRVEAFGGPYLGNRDCRIPGPQPARHAPSLAADRDDGARCERKFAERFARAVRRNDRIPVLLRERRERVGGDRCHTQPKDCSHRSAYDLRGYMARPCRSRDRTVPIPKISALRKSVPALPGSPTPASKSAGSPSPKRAPAPSSLQGATARSPEDVSSSERRASARSGSR